MGLVFSGIQPANGKQEGDEIIGVTGLNPLLYASIVTCAIMSILPLNL